MGFSVEGMLANRYIISNGALKPAEQTSSTSSGLFPMDPPMQSGVLASISQQGSENLMRTLDQDYVYDREDQIQYTAVSECANEMEVQNITSEELAGVYKLYYQFVDKLIC